MSTRSFCLPQDRSFKIGVTEHRPQILHYALKPSASSTAIHLRFVAAWPGWFLEAQSVAAPPTPPVDGTTKAFLWIVASIPGFGTEDLATKSNTGPLLTAVSFKQLMV